MILTAHKQMKQRAFWKGSCVIGTEAATQCDNTEAATLQINNLNELN